jgi:hypothetical protein
MELFAGMFIAISVIGIIGLVGIEIALHSIRPWKKIRKKDLDKYYDLSRGKVRRHKDDKGTKR